MISIPFLLISLIPLKKPLQPTLFFFIFAAIIFGPAQRCLLLPPVSRNEQQQVQNRTCSATASSRCTIRPRSPPQQGTGLPRRPLLFPSLNWRIPLRFPSQNWWIKTIWAHSIAGAIPPVVCLPAHPQAIKARQSLRNSTPHPFCPPTHLLLASIALPPCSTCCHSSPSSPGLSTASRARGKGPNGLPGLSSSGRLSSSELHRPAMVTGSAWAKPFRGLWVYTPSPCFFNVKITFKFLETSNLHIFVTIPRNQVIFLPKFSESRPLFL
jgi:hypothetical protein